MEAMRLVPPMAARLTETEIHKVIESYALGCCFVVKADLIKIFPRFWEWGEFFDFRQSYGPFVGHDMMLFAHCWAKGRVTLLDKPLMQYRIHDTNVFARTGSLKPRTIRDALSASLSHAQLNTLGRLLEAQAAMLRRIRSAPGLAQSVGLMQLEGALERRGRALMARAVIYDAKVKRRERLQSWYRSLASGTYRLGARFFGISRLAVIKDLLAALK
jgi:hypothetical protein